MLSYKLVPLGIARDQFEISAINGNRGVNSGTAGICLGGFEKHEWSKLTFRIFRGYLRKIQVKNRPVCCYNQVCY